MIVNDNYNAEFAINQYEIALILLYIRKYLLINFEEWHHLTKTIYQDLHL